MGTIQIKKYERSVTIGKGNEQRTQGVWNDVSFLASQFHVIHGIDFIFLNSSPS